MIFGSIRSHSRGPHPARPVSPGGFPSWISVGLTVFFLMAIAVTWNGTSVQAEEMLDGLAAVVNQEAITISKVWEHIGPKRRAVKESLRGQELAEKLQQLQQEALNELIDRKLIVDYFKQKGYQLPGYIIEDRIATVIREEHQGDRTAFSRKLASFGYTMERFRKEEMEKIIVASMRKQAVKVNPVISTERLRAFYHQHQSDFSSPEKIHLRMIILRSSERGTIEEKTKFLQEVRERVKQGSKFEELARLYSEDADTAQKGGDWGWIEADTLNETLTKAAFALKPGKISPPVTVGSSVYLLCCEERQAKAVQTFEESRDTIEKVLQAEDRQKAYEEWISGLRKKAYIKIF
jgi:parvulin-like peptidyl-prolyl isomerase